MTSTQTQPLLEAVEYDPFAQGKSYLRAVPSTEAQREIWLACQLGEQASLAYNESLSVRMRGSLDLRGVQTAVRALVLRHEALRATFSDDGQQMLISADVHLDVPVNDLGGLVGAEQDASVRRSIRDEVDRPFDLAGGPLIRALLLQLAPDHTLLVLTAHHIVCDGWSFGVLLRDLAAELGNVPLAPAYSYADYALAECSEANLHIQQADESYWLETFREIPPPLDLPCDRARGTQRQFASLREDVIVDAHTSDGLRAFAAANSSSLFAVMFSAYAALLSRLSGQQDLVVGISAAAQAAQGLDDLVGHGVHMLPVRVRVDAGADMPGIIASARGALLDALDHQSVSFGALLQRLQIARDAGRLPLISAIFNLDARVDPQLFANSGIDVEVFSNPRSAENFELYLNVTPQNRTLVLECQYKTDLFDRESVQRWLDLYVSALQRMVRTPTAPMRELFAPTSAQAALLAQWNATERPYASDLTLGELVRQGMKLDPDACALRFEGASMSYAELEARASGIARALRERGIAPGAAIGVCLPRGMDLVAALLGCVYSGGAYVPLDPTLPPQRLRGMVEDARARVLLSSHEQQQAAGASFGAPLDTVYVEDMATADPVPAEWLGSADTPAYILFTSGSTGRPKGAINSHRGVVNRLLWMQEAFALRPGERVLQKTPFSFDVSVWEFFWPLSVGATLVVARPDGHRDSAYLADLVRSEGIAVMHFVPSMLQFFLDEPSASACSSLRQVVCSGEALDRERVQQFFRMFPETRLANLYGPTEAAVDVSCWECRPGEDARRVPIGSPIANTQLHVLDAQLCPLPPGAVGELYIGGVQVGLGYASNPALTEQRFLADPFRVGGRLYRTGDLARWRVDGVLEYLGRADDQVKVRGYRIELGEIETRLLALPGVQTAAAMAREDAPGDKRIVAYVAGAGLDDDTNRLREALRRELPDFMLPQVVVRLPALPMLSSGKVDRRSLPAPSPAAAAAGKRATPPRDAMESTILAAMESVLKLPGLGVQDDFFALGGHSLLAARLVARLNGQLNLHIPLHSVFEAPTAERLARLLAKSRHEGGAVVSLRHDPMRRSAPLSAQQERIAFMQELHPDRVTYNAPSAHRLEGSLRSSDLLEALRAVVRRQSVLRTSILRDAGAYTQVIHDDVDFNMPLIDLGDLPDEQREAALMQRMQDIVDQPMRLDQAPLFRVALFRLDEQSHVFLFMPHHIIWDGWSFDLLYEEMSSCLDAVVRAAPVALPEPAVSYADYASWQHEWMSSPSYGTLLEEWTARLTQSPAPRALPTDIPRGKAMSGIGASEWVHIDAASTEGLRAIARDADVTINMLSLGLYAAMLAMVCEVSALTIGVPVRGRLTPELEGVMGFFNNLLPLPVQVDRAMSLPQYLGRVKRELVETLRFQEIPFERLAAQPNMIARSAHTGLYQVLFSFQDARERNRNWGPVRQRNVLVLQKGATEDLGLWLMDGPGGLEGGMNYNADVYRPATMQALRDLYLEMVARVLTNPQVRLDTLMDRDSYRAAAGVNHLGAAEGNPKAAAPEAQPRARAEARTLSATQGQLLAVWSDLLGLDAGHIGLGDNFFDIGGDSLRAMEVIARMQRATGKRANPRVLIFETLEQVAAGYDILEIDAPRKAGGLLGKLFGRGR